MIKDKILKEYITGALDVVYKSTVKPRPVRYFFIIIILKDVIIRENNSTKKKKSHRRMPIIPNYETSRSYFRYSEFKNKTDAAAPGLPTVPILAGHSRF